MIPAMTMKNSNGCGSAGPWLLRPNGSIFQRAVPRHWRRPIVCDAAVSVDLSDHNADNPAHLDAIRHLAAMMGGRTHLAGGEASQRIQKFLASADSDRLSSERVVFDGRKQFLYICRERRSLPEMMIEPGSTAVWDNRFRFHNTGSESVVIGVRGRDRKHEEVFSNPPSGDLPGAVRQLIEATEPILLQGRRDLLTVKPIIAQFDEFLPADVLEIGNALAFLGGLDHFPELPTR